MHAPQLVSQPRVIEAAKLVLHVTVGFSWFQHGCGAHSTPRHYTTRLDFRLMQLLSGFLPTQLHVSAALIEMYREIAV